MHSPFRPRLALLLLALPALAAGCDDPTCVFTTGCQDTGGGGIGSEGRAATPPVDGQWISNAPPEVTLVRPQSNQVHPDAPVVLVFSESMSEATLANAFELVPFDGLQFLSPVAIASQALLAEGRMLVLFPAQPLTARSYAVRLRQGTTGGTTGEDDDDPFGGDTGGGLFRESLTDHDPPTDLTGQELGLDEGERIGDLFTVPVTAPVEPSVLATFPVEGEPGAGETTTVAVVFDRPMDAATVTDATFRVLVDGADPVPDPRAAPLDVGGTAEPRVFLWRSEDAAGTPVALPVGAAVEVGLSPGAGAGVILDADGEELPPTEAAFEVAPFRPPLSASLLSQPEDAIGLRNLTDDGDEDLALQVDLSDGAPGDVLELFLFGTSTSETDPQTIALRRTQTLSGVEPIVTASFDLATIDLVVGGDPESPRFADGPLAMALRLRRGQLSSPLRLLDVDPAAPGVQDPVLDTTPPTIESLVLRSDVRDVAIAGTADGVLRSVEVRAQDGALSADNGTLPPVLGSRDDGGFLAAPLGLGVLPNPTVTVTVVGYDAAFNASPPFLGSFSQRGAVGPAALVPGGSILVEAFDAETLAPVEGALVAVHADLGGASYALTSTGTTGPDGLALLATDAAAAEVIVTVDAADRDLVTVHGVRGGRLSLPLRRTAFGATAAVAGSVLAADASIEAILPGLTRRLDDTRRPRGVVRGYPGGTCTQAPAFACPYGPEPILPGRRGAQSFLAGDFTTTLTSFNADLVLQAFCLELPTNAAAAGATQDTTFTLPFLLLDADVVPEEKPEELDVLTFRADGTAGIDTGALDDDPETTGEPRISVETVVPGLAGPLQVGAGLAFLQAPDVWTVRSARPGAVAPGGFFGSRGAVDPDLLVRCELRDQDGNVTGRRPRLSDVPGLFPTNEIAAPDVPALVAPVPGGVTPGRSYDLRLADTLPDATGFAGLYRAELRDATGRGWVLWRTDPTGAGEVRIHVPDLAAAGGTPLADGVQSLELAAYAWGSLDPSSFLWSDVEREQDLFAVGAPVMLTQVP